MTEDADNEERAPGGSVDASLKSADSAKPEEQAASTGDDKRAILAKLVGDGYSDSDGSEDLFGEESDEENGKSKSSGTDKPKSKDEGSGIGDISSDDEMELGDGNDTPSLVRSAKVEELDENTTEEHQLVMDDEGEYILKKTSIRFPSTIRIPNSKALLPDEKLQLTKLPKVLHLEPTCYDESQYDDAREFEMLSSLGKPYCGDNIIRWRQCKDKDTGEVLIDSTTGKPKMESNARFVQWSDGSYQLLVGKQAFDCATLDFKNNFAYSMVLDTDSDKRCLEAQGIFKNGLQFRPTSLTSEVHKQLEIKLKKKTLVPVKVKRIVVSVDPEQAAEERMRTIEGRIRIQRRQRQRESRKTALSKSFLEVGISKPGSSREQSEKVASSSVQRQKEQIWGDESEVSSSESSDSEEKERFESRLEKAKENKLLREKAEGSADQNSQKKRSHSLEDDEENSASEDDAPSGNDMKKTRRAVVDSDSDD